MVFDFGFAFIISVFVDWIFKIIIQLNLIELLF